MSTLTAVASTAVKLPVHDDMLLCVARLPLELT